jgi:hypothetical protein
MFFSPQKWIQTIKRKWQQPERLLSSDRSGGFQQNTCQEFFLRPVRRGGVFFRVFAGFAAICLLQLQQSRP